MKQLIKILFAPIFWVIQACSPLGSPVDESISSNHYFNRSQDDVIFSRHGNWFELGKEPLNADVESFEVLNDFFGKDKNQVYFEAKAISHPALDLGSFYAKSDDYMMQTGFDKNHVYAIEDRKNAVIIEAADPHSYQAIDFYWAKDKERYFFKNQKVTVDYKSFRLINSFFAADNNQAYHFTHRKINAFPAETRSFRGLNNDYAYDNTHIYYLAQYDPRISQIDDPEFERLQVIPFYSLDEVKVYNDIYLRSGDKVYFRGFPVTGADAASFEVVGAYAKDNKAVYYGEKPIPGADAATFQFEEKGFVYRDKNGKYENGKLVE